MKGLMSLRKVLREEESKHLMEIANKERKRQKKERKEGREKGRTK